VRRAAHAALVAVLAAGLACRGEPQPDIQSGGGQPIAPPEAEPPVALNADVPIAYPPGLFDQKIEGDVVLRLFVDSTGKLIPESTRVAESSGFSRLDSAALAGAARLKFAPAKRRGIPVATWFLQPVEFRHPDGSVQRGGP
jgi:periplasmic protein TonB